MSLSDLPILVEKMTLLAHEVIENNDVLVFTWESLSRGDVALYEANRSLEFARKRI